MTDSKNELREMTIQFALSVSDICDGIKGCSSYVSFRESGEDPRGVAEYENNIRRTAEPSDDISRDGAR